MSAITTAEYIKNGDKFKVLGGKEKGQFLYYLPAQYKWSHVPLFCDSEGTPINFKASKNRKVEILDKGYITIKNLRQWEFVRHNSLFFQVTKINEELVTLRQVLGFENGRSDLDGYNDYTIPRSNKNRPVKRIRKAGYNYYVHLIDDESMANFLYDLLNSYGCSLINMRVILKTLLNGYSWAKSRGDELLAQRKKQTIIDFLKIVEWENGTLDNVQNLLSEYGFTI